MITREPRVRRRPWAAAAGVLVVVLCALACAVPVLSGIVASTVVDRILDAPVWVTLLVATAVMVTSFSLLRHRQGARNGC